MRSCLVVLAIAASVVLTACGHNPAPKMAMTLQHEQPVVAGAHHEAPAVTPTPFDAPSDSPSVAPAASPPELVSGNVLTDRTLDPGALASARGLGASTNPDDSGAAKLRGAVAVGGAAVSGGTVSNAFGVVAGMASGFRACYERGLAEDATSRGTLRLILLVGSGGEVVRSTASVKGNLSGTVVSCVRGRAANAQFSAPEEGGARVEIPITFTPAD